ncbi:MAG: glycosyltransferase [Pseudomonadota bacterium]
MHFVDITMFYAAEGGGVNTYLNAKASWLRQCSRVRHSILSPSVSTDSGSPALVRVPGVALPGLHGYRLPAPGASARILARMQPDLIEAGDAGPAAWSALRVKRRLGVPALAYYHSDLAQLSQARLGSVAMRAVRRYLAQLYRQFDMVLAPSRLMVQQLASMGIAGAIHQPLGIDAGLFAPQRRSAALRAQLQLAPDTRLLVYAGRFTPEKKLDVLVDAVARLGRPYHLLLVGGGASLPKSRHVSVLAFMRDQRQLARLLASCDLLVHPGDCETFGLIVLEAMACGLPVVATTGGALAELVDERTGMLVAPNSAAALAEGIAALCQRDLRVLAQAARNKALALYDWSIIMPQLMHRYASLLALHERADLELELDYVPE